MARSVVVVGGGVGGLSAAIYARLRGYDVVVLEATNQVGGKAAQIQNGGYTLDPGPSIIILPRIYESVFADANRKLEDYIQFRRLDPITHVRMEDGPRFDLPAGRDECVRCVRDVAPKDAASFEGLLDLLAKVAPHIDKSIFAHPYDRSWQLVDRHLIAFASRFNFRSTYKELVDEWFTSPLLRAFFYGFPSYGGQSYDSKAPGALLIPYLMVCEGVFYPDGGVGAIPAGLARLARELGVQIRLEAKVVGFRRSGAKISAVRLESGEEVSASAFISNVDRSTTRTRLDIRETAQPSLSYFTLHFGLRKTFSDLRHHSLLIPKDFERGFGILYRHGKFPDPPIVYLNVTSVLDPAVAPTGCTNLFAVVTSPAESDSMNWVRDELIYRDLVIRSLAKFGIDFDETEIDFERVQTPTTFAKRHGNFRGSLYGVDEKERPLGGLFPHSNRDPNYDNLLYCGASVQPGAGLPMVTLSGKFAAQML